MNHFSYLLNKIRDTDFKNDPYKFLLIEDFLENEDFEEIINLPEISLNQAKDVKELLKNLSSYGWEHVSHPGTFSNSNKYLKWRKKNSIENLKNFCGDPEVRDLCEGAGYALRLKNLPSILVELVNFFKSKEFTELCKNKFFLEGDSDNWCLDSGVQKYLHGYEISPHPDIREKALTWMLNLNKTGEEEANYHTHFLKFRKEKEYIYSLWKFYPKIQRQWVPWDWTDTIYQQNKNNSITFFSPSNKTLHAIKASYNDLERQRTQLYGNIFYENIFEPSFKSDFEPSSWKDLEYVPKENTSNLINNFKSNVKQKVKIFLSKKGFKFKSQKR